jgi:hypothetical protein
MASLEQAYFNLTLQLPVEDKTVSDRLNRAYSILNGYGYNITQVNNHGGMKQYKVSKLSTSLLEDNSVNYYVTNRSCTCPDYEKARAGLCKHRLAVMIKEEMDNG